MRERREINPLSLNQEHSFTLMTWNVRNPSLQRAKLQVEWLQQFQTNMLVLTEAKHSKGCFFLCEKLEELGFQVYFPYPSENDYCVIVAVKGCVTHMVESEVAFLPSRAVSVLCETPGGMVECVGVYVPSRGAKERKNEDKRQFQEYLREALWKRTHHSTVTQRIVAGDLNVLERNHSPHYAHFGEWEYAFYESFLSYGLLDAYRCIHPVEKEYSWFGRGGNGYRFDHIFLSEQLSLSIRECSYLQEPKGNGLSDHAAMRLRLAFFPMNVNERITQSKYPCLDAAD